MNIFSIGDYYFKRFCIKKNGKVLIFPTKAMVDQELLRDISIKDWSHEVREYIKICNHDAMLQCEDCFFIFHGFVYDIIDGDETRVITVGVSLHCILLL